jgi:hypothetical protein
MVVIDIVLRIVLSGDRMNKIEWLEKLSTIASLKRWRLRILKKGYFE